MTTSWRGSLAAYAAWLAAHAVAGLLFAAGVALIPQGTFWVLLLHGVLAGALFGTAQWLVLRRVLPGVRWWLPVTVVASPVSWFWGYFWGVATLAMGGWLGWAISALAQMALLVLAFRNNQLRSSISVAWLPAALVGSAIFYFAYLYSVLNPIRDWLPVAVTLTIGSVGFATVTGIVVAFLVSPWATRTREGRS